MMFSRFIDCYRSFRWWESTASYMRANEVTNENIGERLDHTENRLRRIEERLGKIDRSLKDV